MSEVWLSPGAHGVRLHDNLPSLCAAISEFFTDGARDDDALVLISRRATFEGVAALLASGRYGPLDPAKILYSDAPETLATFMDGDTFNEVRAAASFRVRMEEIRRSHPRGTIRFYGEMVDLLCERGNFTGAIALERLCQDLFIREPQLVILCGYARERFPGPGSAAHFDAVCGLHTHLAHPGDAGGGAALLGKRPPLRDTAAGPPPSHVYVIDDDPRIRRSLGRLLGLSFTQLRLFESAEDFLAGLDDLAAGCMVIDIQLGGMSGLDLLARMRTVRPAWPAIVMSATDNPALPGKALALGARLFLAKPFNPQLLVDAVAAALA